VAQHDYVIANGTGAAVRSDLNNALAAIVSQNSGATEPATMYAYQWWADTTTGLLKLRNAANNAWITLRELDGTLTIEAGTVSAPGLAFASDLNTGVWSPGADQFAIATNGVERVEWGTSEVVFNDGGTNYDFRVEGDTNANLLFVDASADAVGIGTSSPNVPLQVIGGSTVTDPVIRATNSGATQSMALTSAGLRMDGGAPIQINQGGSEVVRIDTSGRVGIGTTGPQELLDVYGTGNTTVRISGSSGGGGDVSQIDFFRIGSNVTSSIKAIRDGGNTSGALTFLTASSGTNSERARIDASGRLLVGTSTGQARLTVWDTDAGFATARIFKNVANTQSLPALLVEKVDNTSTTSQVFIGFTINNQATASGQINANGASQAAFGSWSDARLKENIVDLPSQWSAMKTLRPVEFDYIESEGGGHQIGFVAQEVQKVYPDVVGERGDGMLTLSGMGKNESRLIKALQEAIERIEQLEAKVAALESQ
jgi:hypothetical protein